MGCACVPERENVLDRCYNTPWWPERKTFEVTEVLPHQDTENEFSGPVGHVGALCLWKGIMVWTRMRERVQHACTSRSMCATYAVSGRSFQVCMTGEGLSLSLTKCTWTVLVENTQLFEFWVERLNLHHFSRVRTRFYENKVKTVLWTQSCTRTCATIAWGLWQQTCRFPIQVQYLYMKQRGLSQLFWSFSIKIPLSAPTLNHLPCAAVVDFSSAAHRSGCTARRFTRVRRSGRTKKKKKKKELRITF